MAVITSRTMATDWHRACFRHRLADQSSGTPRARHWLVCALRSPRDQQGCARVGAPSSWACGRQSGRHSGHRIGFRPATRAARTETRSRAWWVGQRQRRGAIARVSLRGARSRIGSHTKDALVEGRCASMRSAGVGRSGFSAAWASRGAAFRSSTRSASSRRSRPTLPALDARMARGAHPSSNPLIPSRAFAAAPRQAPSHSLRCRPRDDSAAPECGLAGEDLGRRVTPRRWN